MVCSAYRNRLCEDLLTVYRSKQHMYWAVSSLAGKWLYDCTVYNSIIYSIQCIHILYKIQSQIEKKIIKHQVPKNMFIIDHRIYCCCMYNYCTVIIIFDYHQSIVWLRGAKSRSPPVMGGQIPFLEAMGIYHIISLDITGISMTLYFLLFLVTTSLMTRWKACQRLQHGQSQAAPTSFGVKWWCFF